MDQFLLPILEWISTTHGSGRHEQYGWVIISSIAISIAASLNKAEKSNNKKEFILQQIETLKKEPLLATTYSEENKSTIKYTACIREDDEGYRVTAQALKAAEETLLLNETAKTLEAIELLVKEKTPFTISDFRPSNGK